MTAYPDSAVLIRRLAGAALALTAGAWLTPVWGIPPPLSEAERSYYLCRDAERLAAWAQEQEPPTLEQSDCQRPPSLDVPQFPDEPSLRKSSGFHWARETQSGYSVELNYGIERTVALAALEALVERRATALCGEHFRYLAMDPDLQPQAAVRTYLVNVECLWHDWQ